MNDYVVNTWTDEKVRHILSGKFLTLCGRGIEDKHWPGEIKPWWSLEDDYDRDCEHCVRRAGRLRETVEQIERFLAG